MSFDGKDWMEISTYFGICENSLLNEEDILKKTREFLGSALYDSDAEEKVAEVIRNFLTALYTRCSKGKHTGPLWKGLLEIEDNFTLIKYTCILLEHMWY
ncbi:hypothetical protein [Gorillibacterium sp. sgz5001074]|uniref:hypothetical protein n=1 Tax=Gorillibacterium sp. sgz5001074 TaxID=3446695 RepID=UPI003F6776D5